MNDDDFGKQQARVLAFSDKWRDRLWLSHWRVVHFWERSGHKDDTDTSHVPAQASVQWKYMRADVTWYLPTLARMPDDEVEECVIHELLHLIVAEMATARKQRDGYEERVVTHLARALNDMAKESQGESAPEGQQPKDNQHEYQDPA